ncbi:MAG: hypothetical protein M3O22_02365 [Pseudomonadota bacterium]|nr:hypothetical protein [Pseudomonadota bacterium]
MGNRNGIVQTILVAGRVRAGINLKTGDVSLTGSSAALAAIEAALNEYGLDIRLPEWTWEKEFDAITAAVTAHMKGRGVWARRHPQETLVIGYTKVRAAVSILAEAGIMQTVSRNPENPVFRVTAPAVLCIPTKDGIQFQGPVRSLAVIRRVMKEENIVVPGQQGYSETVEIFPCEMATRLVRALRIWRIVTRKTMTAADMPPVPGNLRGAVFPGLTA